MSGIRYMFDTNALISFFNKNAALGKYVLLESKIIISIISVLEFLSFNDIKQAEKDLFEEFCSLSEIIKVDIDNKSLIKFITFIRINYKLKLPDAIITASAIKNNAVLITNNKQLSIVPNLQILAF